MPNAAVIAGLVDRLDESEAKTILVDLLLADTETPAPRRGRKPGSGRVVSEERRVRYLSNRKAKRIAAQKVAAAPPAPTPAATKMKVKPAAKSDRRKGSKWGGNRKAKTVPASNGAADEAWMGKAREVHSVAAKLPEHAER